MCQTTMMNYQQKFEAGASGASNNKVVVRKYNDLYRHALTLQQAVSNASALALLTSLRKQQQEQLEDATVVNDLQQQQQQRSFLKKKPRAIKAACSKPKATGNSNLLKMRRIGGEPLSRPPALGNSTAMFISKQRRLVRQQQQQMLRKPKQPQHHAQNLPDQDIAAVPSKKIQALATGIVGEDEQAFCDAVMLLKQRLQVTPSPTSSASQRR